MQDIKKITIQDLIEANPEELEVLCQTIIDGLQKHGYRNDKQFLAKARDIFKDNNMMFEAASMIREIGVSDFIKGEAAKGISTIETAVEMLKNVNNGSNKDEVLFNYMLDIAVGNYEVLNFAKSFIAFEECSKMINNSLPTRFLYRYYFEYAILSIYIEQYSKALGLLDKALLYTGENRLNKGNVYNNFGRCYWQMKDYEKSIEMYNEALELYAGNNDRMATIYNNMSLVYNELNNHDMSIELINKCLEIFDKNNPKKHLIYYDTYIRVAINSEDLHALIEKLLEVIKISKDFYTEKRYVIDSIEILVHKTIETKNRNLGVKLRDIIISLIDNLGEEKYRGYYENQLYACLGELSYLLGSSYKLKGGV